MNIEIKEQTITIKLSKQGSKTLTDAMSCLIDYKKKNTCSIEDCEDCKINGNKIIEQDTEKLAKEILDLYFDMYKISMSTTKIPSLQEIRESIKTLN